MCIRDSINPVDVWEAHKSRSVLLVSVCRLPGMLRSHDLSCLAVFGGLPDGSWTCSGAPKALLGGSWKLLGALEASQVTIHRPCRCLGGSQVTICRACQCLEASQNAPKSRSIVPVGVWRPLRGLRHLSTWLRPGFDPASAHLIDGGLGPALKASLEA